MEANVGHQRNYMYLGRDILQVTEDQHRQILNRSVAAPELEAGLAPVRQHPIRCYRTEPRLIAQITQVRTRAMGLPDANATCFKSPSSYDIFVDRDGDPAAKAAIGNHSERFCVLHEHAHILHGDLPHDRITDPNRTYTDQEVWPPDQDIFAHGYAMDTLAAQLENQDEQQAAKILRYNKRKRGFVGPTDHEYQQRFP